MAVSLSDILTATKNIVTALNNAAQTYLNVNGISTKINITTPTLVKSGAGRVATVSIITGGSAGGTIYDSNSITSLTNPIFTVINTPGIVFVNCPVQNGIVVIPSSGQNITVTYS
jgi:hypothetical protein